MRGGGGIEFKVGVFGLFLSFLQQNHKALDAKKEDPSTFDLLAPQNKCLVMACIRGKDGKEDHCICIYTQWIYDSNFENALVLTNKSIGVCCSSVDQETQFDGCANVVSFPDMYLLNSKQ
jgi:hypothetical protein